MALDAAYPHLPTLTTARLRLRAIVPGDAAALFAIRSDEEVMRYYGHPAHRSRAETEALIAQIAARYTRREALRWGITLTGGDDRLIGSCSLHHIDEGARRSETGYELHRAWWGQGIMAEAMTATLNFAFTDLCLHRVEAVIDDANTRSKRLLLSLGFTFEGVLRERYHLGNDFEDEYYFGLLDREWRGRLQAIS